MNPYAEITLNPNAIENIRAEERIEDGEFRALTVSEMDTVGGGQIIGFDF